LTISKCIFRRENVFFFEKTLSYQCFKMEAELDVNVRIVQDDDFPKISNLLAILENEFKTRFKMGHLCFGAESCGEFVHLTWASFNEAYVGSLERKLQVGSCSAYIYDTYTFPKYRGQGIAPKVMSEALNYLSKMKNIQKVYLAISRDNFSSLKTASKVGFRKIGVVTLTRIYKLKLYRFKGETEEDYNKLRALFII